MMKATSSAASLSFSFIPQPPLLPASRFPPPLFIIHHSAFSIFPEPAMTFSTDSDLLLWEPNLLSDAAFMSQTLIAGTADLANTTLSIAGGNLLTSHVQPDQVVILGGTISGCFPIVSVDSASSMTISILYEGVWPDQATKTPSRVGSATALTFAVRTFYAQRRLVADLLRRAIGIETIPADVAPPVILNPDALRRASTLGTLQMIYSALAAAAEAPDVYQIRADLYQRLYRRELSATAVHLDTDADGHVDLIRRPNVIVLRRE
jgi:hypothetical protein